MEHIHVNGVDLPYRDQGEGQPIVMVHGAGPDMDTLGVIAADLAADHRVITYNRRGYWQAGEPATSLQQHREDLAAMLDQWGIRGAAVVAFSGGAIPAVDLAVERPDLVGRLVLHDPAIYGKRHVTLSMAKQYMALQWRRRMASDERAHAGFLRWVMRHPDGTSAWDRPDYTDERTQVCLRNARAAMADIAIGDGSHIPVDRLGGIACTVTLVLGERSQPWFHKIARTLQQAFPEPTVTQIPGVGHGMTFEDPAAVAKAIRGALEDSPT